MDKDEEKQIAPSLVLVGDSGVYLMNHSKKVTEQKITKAMLLSIVKNVILIFTKMLGSEKEKSLVVMMECVQFLSVGLLKHDC